MRQFYNRRNILILLSLLILVSSAFIIITYRNIRKTVTETRNVNNSLQSLRVLEDLMDDMQDIESGQRGYVISGNRQFLASYFSARQNLEKDSMAVRALQTLYPLRARVLERLLYFVRQKANMTAVTVDAMDRNLQDSADQLIRSGRGRETMDSIRSLVFSLESEDRHTLQYSNTERQDAARKTARLLIIMVLVLLTGLIFLFTRLYRGLKLSREYEKQILYLASLTEKTSDAIFSLDMKGYIISWNKGAENMYGYSKEEAIGRFAPDITHSGYTSADHANIIRRIPEKGSIELEVVNYNRKGEAIHCLASVTALKDEKGETTGFVTVMRDISERKRAEQLLAKFNEELNRQVEEKTAVIQESEERYRRIVETAQEGIWMIDKNNCTSFVNDRMAEMLGYTRQEMMGRQIFEFMDEQGIAISERNIQRRRSGISDDHEFKFLTRDGRAIWTLMSTSPLEINGENTGTLAMVIDITERKKTADDIKRSQESFELISRTTNDAIWEWNLETNQLWANETHQRLYGLSLADPVPTESMWAERIHPDDRNVIIKRQEETLASDKNVFISEYRFRTEDKGYRDLYDRCYIVRNKEGKPIRMTGSMMDITERKKAEQAIKESEEKYRKAQWIGKMGHWELDLQNNRLSWSDEIYRIFGIEKSEFGANYEAFFNTIHPDDREAFQQAEDEALAGKKKLDYVHRIIRPDGDIRYVHELGELLRNEKGEPVILSGTVQDITQRIRAEEEVRKSEETRKLIMDSALDAIVCINNTGIITVWTPQTEKIFGWKAEEVLGKRLSETIIPLQYRSLHENGMEKFRQTGEGPVLNRLIEITAINKEGREFPIELSVIPIRQGDDFFFCAFIRDITERKLAEERIFREKELSDTAVNSLPGIFYMFDINRNFLRWNKNFELVSGYGPEELKTLPPLRFFAEDDRELARQKVEQTFREGEAELEARFLTRQGEKIPYLFTGRAITYNGVLCMVGTGIDISELKKAEQELAATNESLRKLTGYLQQIREEERSHIAREIHDELGQQLTVLKMDISWLNKKIDTKEEKVKERLRDLVGMVDKTVKSVRKISSELRPSMLDDLGLPSALEWQGQEFEKRSGIKVNLLNSAGDYKLPNNVAITLFRIFQEGLTNVARHAEASEVWVTLQAAKDYLSMEIRDNGKGFVVRDIENKKTLGILGMRERISLISGTFSIESSPGKGTCIRVNVPIGSEV